jgi:hypothetical protein
MQMVERKVMPWLIALRFMLTRGVLSVLLRFASSSHAHASDLHFFGDVLSLLLPCVSLSHAHTSHGQSSLTRRCTVRWVFLLLSADGIFPSCRSLVFD